MSAGTLLTHQHAVSCTQTLVSAVEVLRMRIETTPATPNPQPFLAAISKRTGLVMIRNSVWKPVHTLLRSEYLNSDNEQKTEKVFGQQIGVQTRD